MAKLECFLLSAFLIFYSLNFSLLFLKKLFLCMVVAKNGTTQNATINSTHMLRDSWRVFFLLQTTYRRVALLDFLPSDGIELGKCRADRRRGDSSILDHYYNKIFYNATFCVYIYTTQYVTIVYPQ